MSEVRKEKETADVWAIDETGVVMKSMAKDFYRIWTPLGAVGGEVVISKEDLIALADELRKNCSPVDQPPKRR